MDVEAIDPPDPETMLQVPVPFAGLFAAKVVLVPQIVWFGPALAAVVLPVTVTTILSFPWMEVFTKLAPFV